MDRSRLRLAVAVALACGLAAPGTARAADPGRWTLTGKSTIPLNYYQGLASTAESRPTLFFDGIHVGLYRTDSQLRENGRVDDVIPPTVTALEGYNHIGDIAYDEREGGRVLLPVECYYPNAAPGQADPHNTCRTGSIGVADPRTLQWRYYVKLDPAEIPKAMWAAVSPDGQLLWTSSGPDLLAYRLDDVHPANAAPAGSRLRAVRRIPNGRPPSGITGAVFFRGRLFVASQADPVFQIWSIDLDTGERQLEFERAIVGESEGLDVFDALGGVLHWIVAPYNTRSLPSEGSPHTSTLLHLVPRGESAGTPAQPAAIRVTVAPRRVPAGRRTTFAFRASATIAGRRTALSGVRVRFAGRSARTNRAGRARLRLGLRRPWRYRVRASRRDLRPGFAFVRAVRPRPHRARARAAG